MILRSRFFWKLYLTYTFLVLTTSAIVGILIHTQLKKQFIQEMENSLRVDGSLLGSTWQSFQGASSLNKLREEIRRLGERTKIRYTLIFPDGRVLADSAEDPDVMENHGDRPEILAARQKGYGSSLRFSETVRESMLYVAQPIFKGHQFMGFVRVALPLVTVSSRLFTMKIHIVLGALFGVFIALLLGLIVAGRVIRPVLDMTSVAESMRQGNYHSRIFLLPKDELGILGDTLNRLGEEIVSRMKTLSKAQAQLTAMLSSMVEGIIAVDREGGVLFCNRAFCELFCVESLAPPGKKIWEIVRHNELLEALEHAKTERLLLRQEIVVTRASADLTLNIHAAPFGDGQGVVMVFHDVTELRKLERMRSEFVANVSHELKTPLTSIKGYVETLMDGALFDQGNNVKFLKKIDDHVQRLQNLVQDLLSLARIESGKAISELKPMSWSPVVERVIQRHEPRFIEKSLIFSVVKESSPEVLGDAEAMTQILDNLIDNATKYNKLGGQIILRMKQKENFGILEIEDSGIGIPKPDIDRIFERFYRLDKARSRDTGGTGLGLSIVKHLVQAMKGRVEVSSEVGSGTTFTVSLPLAG